MVSADSHDNSYTEWTQDTLATIDLSDADSVPAHEGQDITGDDSILGERVGNHSQINFKSVILSERVQNTENIGRSNELAYQVKLAA